MLSIEEIKLTIEKLEKIKGHDFQKLIDENLKILRSLAMAVDMNNGDQINRLDKTKDWYAADLEWRHARHDLLHDQMLFDSIVRKINDFGKAGESAHLCNSLEIGPGYGKFSKCFLAWRLNYFVDVVPHTQTKVKKLFLPPHLQFVKFHMTNWTACPDIPSNSVNFVFSWDTFPFFTQQHIKLYLKDIHRVTLPGGYVFLHYANCEYDHDLNEAKRGYWNYNTKSAMSQLIKECGYTVIEMSQFKTGANYAIFQKPGKDNPVLYKVMEIPAKK
jgi:hypothetical protein